MAKVIETQSVPWRDATDGSLPWTLWGSVDTATGETTYIAYGASGGTMAEGTAAKVIKTIQSISEDPIYATFISDFNDAVSQMEAKFNERYPRVVQPNAVNNVNDFTDVAKVAGPAAGGLVVGFSGIGSKFTDLGGSLTDPSLVSGALGKVSLPSVDKFTSMTKSLMPSPSSLIDGVKGELSGLMNSVSTSLKNLTGSGAGKLGVPSLKDVMGPLTGESPAMRRAALGNITPEVMAAIDAECDATTAFFETAGIDLDTPAPLKLGSVMSFGTNLHKLGADANGFGTASMIRTLATDDAYGEAIKASIAEGKNNAALAEAGIPPPVCDAPTDYTKERDKLDAEETRLSAIYSEADSVKVRLSIVEQQLAVRQKILDLDSASGNDPDLMVIDNQVLTALNDLSVELNEQIRDGAQ